MSLKHKYVFFQVGKSASITVKHHLQGLEVAGTGRKIFNVNNRNLSPHIWPSQLSKGELEKILVGTKFRKIAFVRSPFSRILSCYLHRICAQPDSSSNRALAKANNSRCGPEITFEEFVRVICNQGAREQESHWRVQSDEIFYEYIKGWAFIGKFESLQDDINSMLSLVGNATVSSPKVNKSPRVTGASKKVKEYYNLAIQKLVVDRFRADFENFGYNKEIE